MKMPATTATKVEAKPPAEMGDATKQCLLCLEKKVRNLEKRKVKIESNKEKAAKGTKLEKEQEISLKQYEQVTHDLELSKELHKQFQAIHLEHEKMLKKQAKREKMERQAMEIKRISEILQLQSTLDLMGGDNVREDFKTGKHGAVVLTDDNLDQLDQLYQAISPSRDDSGSEYPQKLTTAAEHLVNIVDGKDRQVLGTTYKELKGLLTLINECGYFEAVKAASEEVVEEEEESTEPEAEETPVTESLSEETETTEEPEVTSSSEQAQQPIDLSTATPDGGKSHLDMPSQPMNTLEQDAFFAPSSTTSAYEQNPSAAAPSNHFNQQQQQQQQQQQPQQATDFQSFTNNRPFQFIQASFIMPEAQTAPNVVDPAVIHAQPAAASSGGSSLTFMQPVVNAGAFDAAGSAPQSASQQNTQSQPPSQGLSNTSSNATVAAPLQPQGTPAQDFNTGAPQGYGQQPVAALQQSLQFPSEEVTNPLSSHQSMMGQMRGAATEESSSTYEIPPSIPMPPSQQQTQQVASGAVPPPNVGSNSPPQGSDYNAQNSGSDFQQGYQGNNGFTNSMYSRGGGRGGGGNYRGGNNSRNGGGANGGGPNGGGNMRNGSGSGPVQQNGFGGGRSGGPMANNGRGGGRGGYGYSSNLYRQDGGFQNSYNSGGFNSYPKRGGMNQSGGPPMGNSGYNRGGSGGMRGGMPRGGGGQRGGGGMRGGFNRPMANQ